MVQPDSKKDQH